MRGINTVVVSEGNNPVIQNNVQSGVNDGIIMNNKPYSKKSETPAQIYEKLALSGQNKLLNPPFKPEDKQSVSEN